MGKTLGFAIPVIVDAVISSRNIGDRVPSQLLIYPRVALALDQYEEFKNYLKYVNSELSNEGHKMIVCG